MSLTSLNNTKKRAAAAAAVALSSALFLSACSDDGEDKNDASTSAETTQSAESADSADDKAADEQALEFNDSYVTAKAADKNMTSVFGTLHNTTDKDITITEVKGDIDGAKYELHEVNADGEMQEISSLTIPAGEDSVLEPGGNHIMIMEVSDEIAAGDSLSFTLVDEDGNEYKLDNVPVRVQQSTHEHYGDEDDGNMEGMDGMQHGDMDGMDGMQHGEEHGHEH
ncbi:copper chaperone PCu(A)C [Corynebacterium evansiae]|uniref:copper chaperone PCu(A)C n=1 Tax=Corynebacterium evansiae TaxID=2913499 RepID=UPI003EBC1D5F